MAVGRIWGSFSCPSKEGSGRRTHEGLPMHPLGGRELYRVAWLILGLASGCLLTPRYVYFPRFFSIAFFFLLFPVSAPTRISNHVDFSIHSFYLFLRSWKALELFRKKKKKRKNFDFRSPRFRKGIFSIFPSLSRIHVFPLVLVTFSYFSFLRPSLLAWRPLEPRRVAADSWSGFLIYASLLSGDPTLLRFFIPYLHPNRTSVSSSSPHPSPRPPLIHPSWLWIRCCKYKFLLL